MDNRQTIRMTTGTYSQSRGEGSVLASELTSHHSLHTSPGTNVARFSAKMGALAGIVTILVFACQTPGTERPGKSPSEKMGQVVIQWPTEYGADVYGFNIYRSESAQGPFTRVNTDIIPSSSGENKEYYRYIDKPLALGKTYFYYIESISYAGQKRKMTPVLPINAVP